MKRFLRLLLVATVLCGCEGFDFDGGSDSGLKFSDETDIAPVFTAEGGTVTVAFTSDYDWSVSASDTWILFSPSAGAAGDAELLITLAENTTDAERTGNVTITLSNEKTYDITVRQQSRKAPEPPAGANNEILYTTSDGNAVNLFSTEGFGANIVSNTYENGQGRIVFDGDVTAIGEQAFCYCENLTSIIIPNSVTAIKQNAFFDCRSLTDFIIPDSVTSIEWCAFGFCRSLTSIAIPDGVTTMGGGVFAGCTNMERFEGKFASEDNRCLIANGGSILFAFAPAGLTEYTIPYGVTSIFDWTFRECDKLTDITIPASVTEIRECAFLSCSSLTSITIPTGVTSIGNNAFSYCSGLTGITIPDSITEMGTGVFAGCTNLERFDGAGASADNRCLITGSTLIAFAPAGLTEYTIPNNITEIGAAAFAECSNLTSIIIPDGVTSIGYNAFEFCENLSSITIPDGVTSIEGGTFWGCSSLSSIIIPDGVTSIGNNAFESCKNLSSITIPDGVTTIGAWAFSYCDNLLSITIPENVTSIGDCAFFDCVSLQDVYCKPVTPPAIGEYAFFYSRASVLQNIYVPTSSVDAYKASEGWNVYSTMIFGYDF